MAAMLDGNFVVSELNSTQAITFTMEEFSWEMDLTSFVSSAMGQLVSLLYKDRFGLK